MNKLKFLWIISLLGLSACSSHVSGEWDCPRQEGQGCITINNADQVALQKIEDNGQDKVLNTSPQFKARKVWFAPHMDKFGNQHQASEVTYYERSVEPERDEEGGESISGSSISITKNEKL